MKDTSKTLDDKISEWFESGGFIFAMLILAMSIFAAGIIIDYYH